MEAKNKSLLILLALTIVSVFAWFLHSVTGGAGVPTAEPAPIAADGSAVAPDADTGRSPDPTRRALDVPPGAPGMIQVRGRVLDPYGEVLANALVGDAASNRPATTAADGRFAFDVAERSVTLLVLAAGHAPLLVLQEIEPGARLHEAGDLQLLRGGGIRGRILDPHGNGLRGATATLRLLGPGPAAILGELLAPAVTDQEGSYAFSHLAPGPYRIAAAAPEMQPAQSGTITVREGSETVVDPLRLAAGYDLAGLVLGPGDGPVAGALVRIGTGSGQNRPSGQAETAADGRFRAGPLPPGPLWVEVTGTGYLRRLLSGVDPARGEELVVRLESGLCVAGIAVDAGTGRPVESFAASIRRIGRLDPGRDGTVAQQLGRRREELRAEAAAAGDLEVRLQMLKIAAEFESRLERVGREGRSRPVAMPAELGPVAARPGGRFSFDGLEEGIYAIWIVSPDHQAARAEPIELRRGPAAPELRLELVPGYTVSGTVVAKNDGAPVVGAAVELVRVLEAPAEARAEQRSLYPWAFARSGPQGVTVAAARTDGGGRFLFRHAAPGSCFLSVRHARIADYDTEPFHLPESRQELRIAVGALAGLRGRVGTASPGWEGGVEVFVLGGHGAMRAVKAQADGTYRIDGLQPGDYLVRAFPAGSPLHASRLFNSIFPLHAGAVDPERIPPRDVTLAEGETRLFDLVLELPPTGIVEGSVSINGRPGRGGRAILRPLPGEAPGAGGLALRAECDEAGRFAIRDVPVGKYMLFLYSPTSQELHGEAVAVAPAQIAAVRLELAAGGLSGRIVAPDPSLPEELRGYLWVLPGAAEAPADLYDYRNTRRTHRIRIRDGLFADDGLTVGPAVLVVDLRGRKPAAARAVVAAGVTLELELGAGERRQ